MSKKFGLRAMALAFSLALSAGAQASFLSSQLTSGVLNGFKDDSLEAPVDVNRNGVFDVGDVLIGFLTINQKNSPNNVQYDNNIYAIFTQQMVAQAPQSPFQVFAPTTVPGLRLSDIVPGADANGVVAMFSSATSVQNLITTPPAGATTLNDYFSYIKANLTLDAIAGFGGASTNADNADFLTAIATIPADFFPPAVAPGEPGCATNIACLQPGQQVATFTGGLSILQLFGDMLNFTFADDVAATNPLAPGVLDRWQVGVSSGNATGASTDPNFGIFGNASGFAGGPWSQCGWSREGSFGEEACGFSNNLDFTVRPTRIPEPATIALLGAALFGIGAARRRRTR